LRQYTDGEHERHMLRGAVTGKDVRIGGSEGRNDATGQGVAYCIEDRFEARAAYVKGQRVILQGYGNVGSWAARILQRMGARVVAVTDADGGVFAPEGLDAEQLFRFVHHNPSNLRRSVAGYPEAQALAVDDLFDVDADVFVPAALGGVITAATAERLKVSLVAEGANSPTTGEGDAVLARRNIDVIPDVIANSGGVTVSYYEWLQNNRMEHWAENEVNAKLERAIKSNYRVIRDVAEDENRASPWHDATPYRLGRKVSTRQAAMVLALRRIEAHYAIEGFSQL
ncbi:MAG: glutamate dehydrogenase, partial [Myxococcota bacterium]